MAKKQLDAMDRYFAEDNPENPTVQLPDDNEKKGEDNGQGSEAAGALSENDNPEGLSTVKPGDDEISGTNSTEYDNVYAFLTNEKEDGGEGKGDDGDDDDKGDDGDDNGSGDGDGEGKGTDGEGTGDGEGKNCNGKGRTKPRKNEDAPENPKTDLPDDNEKKGEDNGQGSEAAGALSENDNPDGLTTVKTGEDEISGTNSTEYDNAWNYFDTDGEDGDGEGKGDDDGDGQKGDDDGEGSGDGDGAGDGGKKGGDGEGTGDGEGKDCNGKGGKGKGKGKPRKNEDDGNKGSDDDGASKKDPVTGPDDGKKGDDDGDKGDDDGKKGDDDDAPIDDFFRVADEDDFEKPENLPGTTQEPDPVDGEGNKVDPNGDPDLPSNLTEQPLETVATPPGSTAPLANSMSRYFFG